MTPTEITRDDWKRRYAARIMDRAKWDECSAVAASEAGASAYEESERAAGNTVIWWGVAPGSDLTPEDAADEEMSYWTDDGGLTP